MMIISIYCFSYVNTDEDWTMYVWKFTTVPTVWLPNITGRCDSRTYYEGGNLSNYMKKVNFYLDPKNVGAWVLRY